MTRVQRWLLSSAGVVLFGMVGIGVLIAWPEPSFDHPPSEMSPETATRLGLVFDQVYEFAPVRFAVRDGIELFTREFIGDGDAAFVLLHGITADSAQMNKSAGLIRDATSATVYAVDLRGHGASEGISGDVDYVGQYEDDVLDIVNVLRRTDPGRRVFVAGHSMGGGIAQRLAMRAPGVVDGFLLFAPLMGYGAPTMRSPARNGGEGGFMRVHIPRVAGLGVVNAVGIRRWNDRTVLFHNLPESMRTRSYTFRAMLSMAPERFEAGVAALTAPTLVVVGEGDEAFDASAYPDVFATNAAVRVTLLPGVRHNDVTHDPASMAAVQRWWAPH